MMLSVKYVLIHLALLSFLASCVHNPMYTSQLASSQNQVKTLLYEDMEYEDRIKTVLFYPMGTSPNSVLNPPVVNRKEPVPLVLEFDDLGKNYANYYVKLYHCNANWTRSNYTDLQIVSDFNETLISNYSSSINTKVRFTHYSFVVPRVRLSGNYLLVVYRNGDQSDLILSRKFIVFDPMVQIKDNVQFATDVKERDTKQQVGFTIGFNSTLDIPNPQDVTVMIRQNYRWDNAVVLRQPLYIQFDKMQLDYNFFDGQNRFNGGNEFRFFDIRNLRMKGMNVAQYATTDSSNTVYLVTDRNRNSLTYSEQIDINGRFVVQRFESDNPSLEADYANVYFQLQTAPDFEGDIYLAGQMTDWRLKPKFKLEYDSISGTYIKNILLKQGYYNYQYCLVHKNGTDWNYFEGDYSLTENFYDIIVYYRPPNQFNDMVIGYANLNYRGRAR
ncbi:MAG TPA: hypothetical protein DCR46_09445 [Cytophagales bacterium]|nr:hypothetical protein [Cytophagales bacterium]